jgi:ankyrin repeat protein
MAKTLPAQPHIAWLKKTAKERLDELRAADPAAKLHQAQLAVAQEYGFKSWRSLKVHVDATSLDGQIVAAAANGNAAALDRLLTEHPEKIGVTGSQWDRPLLHIAADKGHDACVRVLLERGADVKQRDKFDDATALHWAAQEGHLDVVRRLVAAGADIDGEGDEHEMGVVGWATCFRNVQREVADFLLAQGAKPTIFAAIALGRADLVRKLAAAEPSLLGRQMSRFEHRRMPLHFAVEKNQVAMVELLLSLGADPRAKDDRGNTPLNGASSKTDKRIADLLIAAGASAAEQSSCRFEAVVPILNVRNVPASIDYFVQKLGFVKEWDWGSPPDFACVFRDQVRIFLCQGAQGAPGTWMSIFVHDVDALYEDYRRRGAKIRQPPTNFPWGTREMNVEDLDGHRFRLGSDATGPGDGVHLDESP